MKFRTLCTLSLLVLAACSDDEETNTGTDTGADTTVADTGAGDTTVEDTGTDTTVEDTGTDTTVTDTGTAEDTTLDSTADTTADTTTDTTPDIDPALCGNGVIDGAEACDTAIAAGQPGACPTFCDDLCTHQLEGTDCAAACVRVPLLECFTGDDCCIARCMGEDDQNCAAGGLGSFDPPGCGDSIVNGAESCDDGNQTTEACAYGETACAICNETCDLVAGATDFCGDATVDPTEGCDLGANNSDTNALGCKLDCTVPAWPPTAPWYTDTACDLPTCDEAATISTDTTGDWTVSYETLTSDCGNLSNFESRLVVGNIKTGTPHPLDVAGNCDYTTNNALRFVDGAFKDDTLITCEVRTREAGILEMSQSTVVFGDGTATGTATSILTNIPTIPGLVEVPGGRCTATFAITMTRNPI